MSSPSKKMKPAAPPEAGNAHSSPQQHFDRPEIAILDFGSQFTHLIARRVRELNVFCELFSCKVPLGELKKKKKILGIILSGGPSSVYEADAPHLDKEIWDWAKAENIPILGICYGMQEMTHHFGGKVAPSLKREYGKSHLHFASPRSRIFETIPDAAENSTNGAGDTNNNVVWMSHGDKVEKLPEGFRTSATSTNSPMAAMEHTTERLYGIQFHPEVTHTPCGKTILGNFCVGVCGAKPDWNMRDIATTFIQEVREKVGPHGHVLGAVSGGVDSTVAAVLLNKAIGKRFHAVMVDNGCLRLNEGASVIQRLKEKEGIDLHLVDASARFYDALRGVEDPERKRKIIGNLFIEVFQEEAARIRAELPAGESIDYLLQGTLYPDVIESISYKGPSATIKTHHNVGGLPEKMNLKLLEPLRELFKDEVRALGEALGLDHVSVWRHPFPGPGLAIRILGEVNAERCERLRKADDIMIQEIRAAGIYDEIAQAFVVLLPGVRSVGVMGDGRTYENACVVRCVTSSDFMTADWYHMNPAVMGKISSRIINEVKGINRVCYDVSSKPPATVEWE